MLTGVIERFNLVYAFGALAVFFVVVLLAMLWRRRRARRSAFVQMTNYRSAIYIQVSTLADGFDDLLEGSQSALSAWTVSRGGVRRFLMTTKKVATGLALLQEQIVDESVPRELVAAKGTMLRSLNDIDRYIDSVLHARTVEEALDIIGGPGLDASLTGLREMDTALRDYAARFHIKGQGIG